MPLEPPIDREPFFTFIVNGASGSAGADDKRRALEEAMAACGCRGEVLMTPGAELADAARAAAVRSRSAGGAIVAVGGDGTINTVAQAAHDEGCAMGVVAHGTFNYFARTHHLSLEPAAAVAALVGATPHAVQVGMVNGTVFLVNASLGLYPDLLEDRETYKSRFGRSRGVALISGLVTLMREHRQLRLTIDQGGEVRTVRTPTLFVGNNRLQLEQVGLDPSSCVDEGRVAAVMLKPIGTASMLWLMLRGAFGNLGGADDVESFAFRSMVVTPARRGGRRGVKVAFDGEVARMRPPLKFEVSSRPLWLLKPRPAAEVVGAPDENAG